MGCVILLSGGIDSAVAMAVELARRPVVGAVFADYGQHAAESERAAARTVAAFYGIQLHEMSVPLPLGDMEADVGASGPRVVPGRNLALISIAIPIALASGGDTVILGATRGDGPAYKDCRLPFVRAVSELARKTYGARVEAPLIQANKAQVVARGMELGAPLHLTWSCYTPRSVEGTGQRYRAPDAVPCGSCNACRERVAAIGRARYDDGAGMETGKEAE